ncbi:phage tail protein [Lactiplantibacillus plantarum]|nr:phage tail protein [Lactiplantibacillus plantarum]
MQIPVIQAENLLKTANYDWIDKIYRGSIPKDANNNGATTDVVITESENTPSNYANSQFKHWALGVEIQIFYKIATQTDILSAEIELAKMFIVNGWRVEQSKNHTKDPDTGQVTKVFYFTKIEII